MTSNNDTPSHVTKLDKSQADLQIVILSQYIKDLSLENPYLPDSLHGMRPPKISVDVAARLLKEHDAVFESSLQFNVEAQHDGKSFNLLELTYAAAVELKGLEGVGRQYLEPILWVEVPRLLFPFARSIIAQLSVNGGYPPIMIHPVDFATLYAQRNTSQQAEPTQRESQDRSPPEAPSDGNDNRT